MHCAKIWWLMNLAMMPGLHNPSSARSIVQGATVKYHTTHSSAAAPTPSAAGQRQFCVADPMSTAQSGNDRKPYPSPRSQRATSLAW